MLSFGQRLKAIRKEAHITQGDLANKLMVSVQSISKWECDTSMPDISLIVPLASILGVTTDCLLGMGTDQKGDREKLFLALNDPGEGHVMYGYENNLYYQNYELFKDYIKKYPLDYQIKLSCVYSIFCFISNGTRFYTIPKNEEKDLFDEGIGYLTSIVDYDKDTTRIIDAKALLVKMYLLKEDFVKAEAIAEELPNICNLKNNHILDIYAAKGDLDKCLALSEDMSFIAANEYLDALWTRARRISVYGNARKHEAIAAWRDFESAAKFNNKLFKNDQFIGSVFYALNCISNDYIAISEFDKAFEVVEELTDLMISHYNKRKENGDLEGAKRIKDNIWFYMHWCYNRCFETEDNIIANDPRFKKCQERLAALD